MKCEKVNEIFFESFCVDQLIRIECVTDADQICALSFLLIFFLILKLKL